MKGAGKGAWLLLLGLCASCGSGEDGGAGGRPNIVFVLADDLGWKDVGYNGSAYSTPHIDRLAASGIVFTRAYAAAPSCSPTRASILTGRHPARIGLTKAIRNRDFQEQGEELPPPGPDQELIAPRSLTYLPLKETTFATRLRDAGYTTCFVGKWHVGLMPFTPERHGFDVVKAPGYFSATPYFPPYQIPEFEPLTKDEYLTDRLTHEAVTFLREEAQEPFLLYLSHFAVHGPWQAKPELVTRFEAELDPDAPQASPTYAAMIASLDQGVGRVITTLEELGYSDNTLVVFTSDNGPTLARKDEPLTTVAPLRGGKLDLYEGGLRVPTIVAWPGAVTPGTTSTAPILSTDYFPTFLRAAGLSPAPDVALDGVDLTPLLTNGTAPDRNALHFHVPHRRMSCAILRGDEKLIHHFEGVDELYDLGADPGEANDLARERPELTKELRAELFGWLDEVGAKRPRRNPNYRGGQ